MPHQLKNPGAAPVKFNKGMNYLQLDLINLYRNVLYQNDFVSIWVAGVSIIIIIEVVSRFE